ncbi:unnamed protein product [Phaeothamnion confervicola]
MSALISCLYGIGSNHVAKRHELAMNVLLPEQPVPDAEIAAGTSPRRRSAGIYLRLRDCSRDGINDIGGGGGGSCAGSYDGGGSSGGFGGRESRVDRDSPQLRLELWGRAHVGSEDGLMEALERIFALVDRTLQRFPGLLLDKLVACPMCLDKQRDVRDWATFPLEVVETDRECYPSPFMLCTSECDLDSRAQRLLYAGRIAAVAAAPGDAAALATRRLRLVEDCPQLFPAVCCVAVYDCRSRRMALQGTAAVVDGDRGRLLSMAHLFLRFGRDGAVVPLFKPEDCVVLVGTFVDADTCEWRFAADVSWDPSAAVVAYDAPWMPDFPVLLQLRKLFEPVDWRTVACVPFKNVAKVGFGPLGLPSLKLGSSEGVGILAPVTLVAWPGKHLGSSIFAAHGTVARRFEQHHILQLDLLNERGASGGPVLDQSGSVIGLLSQGQGRIGYVYGASGPAVSSLLADCDDDDGDGGFDGEDIDGCGEDIDGVEDGSGCGGGGKRRRSCLIRVYDTAAIDGGG